MPSREHVLLRCPSCDGTGYNSFGAACGQCDDGLVRADVSQWLSSDPPLGTNVTAQVDQYEEGEYTYSEIYRGRFEEDCFRSANGSVVDLRPEEVDRWIEEN